MNSQLKSYMEDGGGHGMVLGGMVAEAVPVITEEAIVVTGGDMQTVVMDGDDTAAEVVAVADTVGDLAVVVDIMEAACLLVQWIMREWVYCF